MAAAAEGACTGSWGSARRRYGPHDGPIRGDLLPAPVDLHGAAKLAAGHLALARRLGLSAAWARIFSVYGPGEAGGSLVPDLVRALLRGERFPLSACAQRWDWLYEDDIADRVVPGAALELGARPRGGRAGRGLAIGRPAAGRPRDGPAPGGLRAGPARGGGGARRGRGANEGDER